MAQVVVDSRVMRDKARTIENAAVTIQTLYAEMLQEVTATTNRMQGEAIETAKERFASMQNVFDTIVKYSLQGTTQGNGLTGGVLPVRFSM